MNNSIRNALAATLFAAFVMGAPFAAAAERIVITPDQLQWFEVAAYPGAKFALLHGDPSQPGPFTLRIKFPPNYQLGPHTHSDERYLTILEGSWKQGLGDNATAEAATPMPPGSYTVIPAGEVHYDISGPYGALVQVTGTGSSSTQYLNPDDHPQVRYNK